MATAKTAKYAPFRSLGCDAYHFRYRVPHFKIKCGTHWQMWYASYEVSIWSRKVVINDRGRTTNTTFYSLPTMRASDFTLCKLKSVISKVHV